MTQWNLIVLLSLCFIANVKAQELVVASAGPDSCAGMDSGYIAYYRCMLQCLQDQLGYDGYVESDFCSENVQIQIIQGDDSNTYTIADLQDALECVINTCSSTLPPSPCDPTSPPILDLPDDAIQEIMDKIDSGEFGDLSGLNQGDSYYYYYYDEQSDGTDGSSGQSSGGTDGSSGKESGGTDGSSEKGSGGSDGSSGKESGGTDGSSGKGSGGTDGSSGKGSGGTDGSSGKGSGGTDGSSGKGSGGTDGSSGKGSGGTDESSGEESGKTDGYSGQLDDSQLSKLIEDLLKQSGQVDASELLSKVLKAAGIQPDQLDGLDTQSGQLDASGLLSKVMKAAGIKPEQIGYVPELQPSQSVGTFGSLPGQFSGLDTQAGGQPGASGMLSKVLQAAGLEPGQFGNNPGLIPGQFGNVPGLVPGQLINIPGAQPGQIGYVPEIQPGQVVNFPASQISQLDASDLLSKLVGGSSLQNGQMDAYGLLSKVLKESGMQPEQFANVFGPGTQNGQLNTFGIQPGQLVDIFGLQPDQSAVSGSQSGIESTSDGNSAIAIAYGDSGEDCDTVLVDNGDSNNPTSDSSILPALFTASSSSIPDISSPATFSTIGVFDSSSGTTLASEISASSNLPIGNTSDEDCKDYDDGSASSSDENTATYSSDSDYYYSNNDCVYYYDDDNSTFSICSFSNSSQSNSSEYYSYDYDYDYSLNTSDSFDSGSSNVFSGGQVIPLNPYPQLIQGNNAAAISNVNAGSTQNQGQFPSVSVFNQYPAIGSQFPAGSQIQGLPANAQQTPNFYNQNPVNLNYQNAGQYGNAAMTGQLLNQNKGQLPNTFTQIQQYPGNVNNGMINQNTNPFNSFFQGVQEIYQNPATTQYQNNNYGNGFAMNQQSSSQVNTAVNGGNFQTQAVNVPTQSQAFATNNFGNSPQLNKQQNNGNVQQFIGRENNPPVSVANAASGSGSSSAFNDRGYNPAVAIASAASGVKIPGQIQTQFANAPNQGPIVTANNFGSIPQLNTPQYNRNMQLFNKNYPVGGVGSAAAIGSTGQTQGGSALNAAVRNSFGNGPTLNFQQNRGNAAQYNSGGNNPTNVFSSAATGNGASGQAQSSAGSNFGGRQSSYTFQNNGNTPQASSGGIGLNANRGGVSSFASSGASAGTFNRPGVSVNSQSFGASVPISQSSGFGSSASAQAQAFAG